MRHTCLARVFVFLSLLCLVTVASSASPDEPVGENTWRGVAPDALRIHEGVVSESPSAERAAAALVDTWLKPFPEHEAAALFRDEDAAFRRWARWQQELLQIRIAAAVASEQLNENKEREDSPSPTVAFFDDVLKAEMSEEAVMERRTARDRALATGTLESALVSLDAEVQVLHDALTVRQLAAPADVVSLNSADALFAVLMQTNFPQSFSSLSSNATAVASSTARASPFGAVLRRVPLAFPALVSPVTWSRLSTEADAARAALDKLVAQYNATDSRSKVTACRHRFTQLVSSPLDRTAGFIDTLDALARPLCPAALSAIEMKLAQIQAALFDPDGRPRGHPEAPQLKLEKASLRRWRKGVTSFCQSAPPELTALRHPGRGGNGRSRRGSRRRNSEEAFSADSVATALALVVKYRLRDSHAGLALPSGLPVLPRGTVLVGLTTTELRTQILPVVLYSLAAALVLSLGFFELQLFWARRVVAERRFAERYAQAVRAASGSAAYSTLKPPSPFSRRALTASSALLTLCPWLIAVAVVAHRLLSLPVSVPVVLHFVCTNAGLGLVAIAFVFWLLASWVIAGLVRAYASLVHSLQHTATAKSKRE